MLFKFFHFIFLFCFISNILSKGRNRNRNRNKNRNRNRKHYPSITNTCDYQTETCKSLINYDMYVFSLQWGNALCLGVHNKYCSVKTRNVERNIFTIHGLWPDFKPPSPSLYEKCNKGRDVILNNLNDPNFPSLLSNLNKYWISNSFENIAFWSHEFNKHGFCYSLRNNKLPIDYFDMTLHYYLAHNLPFLLTKEIEKYGNSESESENGNNSENDIIEEDDLKYVK